MKHCNRCARDLDESLFYKRAKGLQSTCKECRRIMAIEWQRAHPEIYRATQKRRDRSGRRSSYDRVKHAAKAAVRRAVLAGRMTKPSHCAWCSETDGVQGHHDDHKIQLSVIWLCRKCHYKRHKQLGRCK